MVERIFRMEELPSVTGCKRATIYAMIAAGEFPPPVQMGKCVGWRERDLHEYQQDRFAGRNYADRVKARGARAAADAAAKAQQRARQEAQGARDTAHADELNRWLDRALWQCVWCSAITDVGRKRAHVVCDRRPGCVLA